MILGSSSPAGTNTSQHDLLVFSSVSRFMEDWQRVKRCSNSVLVQQVSHSIYVTNFPEEFYVQDLWKTCELYGNVVDVFIPKGKSKAGKRYAFVF